MKRPGSLSIRGFEIPPEGTLLAQTVHFDVPQGIAYERSIAYFKDFHSHDRLNLAFPRGASVIDFRVKGDATRYRIESSSFLWMPTEVVHSQRTDSTVYDNLALFPSAGEIAKVFRRAKAPQKTVHALYGKTLKAKRSHVLEELLQRYFRLRIMESKYSAEGTKLYSDILSEVVRILVKAPTPEAAPSLSDKESESTVIARSLAFIEANLFSPLSTEEIALHALVSPATLFRKFQTELKMSPFDYIRTRRLDEARTLLGRGDYKVGDVGLLVGYEDLTAFSKAFRLRFGASPRSFLKV